MSIKKTKEQRADRHKKKFAESHTALLSLGYSLSNPPRYKAGDDAYAKWQSCNAHIKKLVNLGYRDWLIGQSVQIPTTERPVKTKVPRLKKPSVKRVIPSNIAWLPRDEWEKQTSKFYASQDWRELRYEALRNSDGSCCCCGARKADGAQLHVDHIKPRSKYPELQLDIENLQILCQDCNIGKSNYYDDNWKVKMEG